MSNEVNEIILKRASETDNETARIICPECSHTRKKKKERTMSVTKYTDRFVYKCHHCGVSGLIPNNDKITFIKREAKPLNIQTVNNGALQHLIDRGISMETLHHYGVFETNKFFSKFEKELPAVGFPYFNGDKDKPYAVKYKCTEQKTFCQEGEGGAKSFFGIQNIEEDAKEICITEGEIDALSIYESGYKNVISVPGGAPLKVSDNKIDPKEDKKFSFIWQAKDVLERAEKIIIATDNDAQGVALAEELARRISKIKCFQIKYPSDCKDSNEVLIKHGKDKLKEVVSTAKGWPINGLYDVDHYSDRVDHLYLNGTAQGESTGFSILDPLYTICTGQLSIVTGHPSSGKSEFVDAMMVNLAERLKWKFAVCSFENDPPTHIIKLIEKKSRTPFFEGPTERLDMNDMQNTKKWVGDYFTFIDQNDGEPATIESILERTKIAIMRKGIRGLVIDPYNFIQLKKETTETDAISDMLTKVRQFAKANDIHVWFVAHPAKMMREGGLFPVPKGYDISGSAAWFAKADVGLSVHRDPEKTDGTAEIHVWKCRFKWVGKMGMALLSYNKASGTYSSFEPADFTRR